MTEDDPDVADSHRPSGVDEDLGAERQEEAAHEPGDPLPAEDGEYKQDDPPVAVA